MQALVKKLTSKKAYEFADQIGELFKSLPHLPKGFVEFLVKIAPFFILLGAVLSLFASPVLGLLSIFSVLSLNPSAVFTIFLAGVIALLNAVILFLAFRPLQRRERNGWMLLFWSDMLSIVQVGYGMISGQQGVGSIIGILIGLYILYQMRPAYKK